MPGVDHEGWIARYGSARGDTDAVGVTDLFTGAAVYLSAPTQTAHAGREAIAAYWPATATQQSLELRFGAPFADGRRVAVTCVDLGHAVADKSDISW